MNRAARTSLRLLVSIMLLSAGALANTSANKVDKNTDREHPSRFSKLSIWRRHKDADKTGGKFAKVQQNKQTEHHSRMSKVAFWRYPKDSDITKTPRATHEPVSNAKTKAEQPKPVPRTVAASNKGQKQGQLERKTPAKTPSIASKPKAPQLAHDGTTASLQH